MDEVMRCPTINECHSYDAPQNTLPGTSFEADLVSIRTRSTVLPLTISVDPVQAFTVFHPLIEARIEEPLTATCTPLPTVSVRLLIGWLEPRVKVVQN